MGIRKHKPTTPGRRGSSVADFVEVTKKTPEKALLAPSPKKGGRNVHGRITARHQGGGHKQRYRMVDFRRTKDGVPAKVAAIEYDPNRTARLALRSALTDRHAGGNLVVIDGLDFDEPRTARAVELLETLGLGGRKLLFVVDGLEEAAIKSFRNLAAVHLITFDQLNTYDVLASDTVIFTRDSLDAFLGRSAGEPAADEELVLEEGDAK